MPIASTSLLKFPLFLTKTGIIRAERMRSFADLVLAARLSFQMRISVMNMDLPQRGASSTAWALVADEVNGLIRNGRPAVALPIIERFLDLNPGVRLVEPLWLRAQLLLSLGRPAQAIAAFEATRIVAPNDGQVDLGLAIAHGESGRPEAAELAARSAIGKSFDRPGVRYVLGRALFEQDRFAEAEAEFRQAATSGPQHLAARTSLTELVWMRTGDLDAVFAALASNDGDPGRLELRMIKARLLRQIGAVEQAFAELEPYLDAQPKHAELHMLAAECTLDLDPARSLALITHALRLAPRSQEAHRLHGEILLAAGRADEAAALASRLLAVDENNVSALALQAAAWCALGDPRYQALYDYPHLVRSCFIDVPPGWPSLNDYLTDLSVNLHARHNLLQAHPPTQSARTGTQVELRPGSVASMRSIQVFPAAVDGAIRRYMDEVMARGADAFSRRHTGRYRFNGIWSVRLKSQGHHTSHFHGKGWISSACHITIPQSVSEVGHEGWLKFGRECTSGSPAAYYVKPEPGQLTLFPSWMWHGTVPFTAAPGEYRLSIAFDAVPD